jgi:hypothetical protein
MSIESPGENPLPETCVDVVGGPDVGESVIVWLNAALLKNNGTINIVQCLLVLEVASIMFSSVRYACSSRRRVGTPRLFLRALSGGIRFGAQNGSQYYTQPLP